MSETWSVRHVGSGSHALYSPGPKSPVVVVVPFGRYSAERGEERIAFEVAGRGPTQVPTIIDLEVVGVSLTFPNVMDRARVRRDAVATADQWRSVAIRQVVRSESWLVRTTAQRIMTLMFGPGVLLRDPPAGSWSVGTGQPSTDPTSPFVHEYEPVSWRPLKSIPRPTLAQMDAVFESASNSERAELGVALAEARAGAPKGRKTEAMLARFAELAELDPNGVTRLYPKSRNQIATLEKLARRYTTIPGMELIDGRLSSR